MRHRWNLASALLLAALVLAAAPYCTLGHSEITLRPVLDDGEVAAIEVPFGNPRMEVSLFGPVERRCARRLCLGGRDRGPRQGTET